MLQQPTMGCIASPPWRAQALSQEARGAYTPFSPAEHRGSRPALGKEAFLPGTFSSRALGP
jgi:hypothetical protein